MTLGWFRTSSTCRHYPQELNMKFTKKISAYSLGFFLWLPAWRLWGSWVSQCAGATDLSGQAPSSGSLGLVTGPA